MKSTFSRCAKDSNFCHPLGISGTSNNELDKLVVQIIIQPWLIIYLLYLERGVAIFQWLRHKSLNDETYFTSCQKVNVKGRNTLYSELADYWIFVSFVTCWNTSKSNVCSGQKELFRRCCLCFRSALKFGIFQEVLVVYKSGRPSNCLM